MGAFQSGEPSKVPEAAVGMMVESRSRRRSGQLPWGPRHLGDNLWGMGSSTTPEATTAVNSQLSKILKQTPSRECDLR